MISRRVALMLGWLCAGPILAAWPADPEARLTGPARVDPGALILLSPAGSVSDTPPVVVSEVGQPPELDPRPLYTPDGKGGFSPFAWIATAPTIHGTYRFISIACGDVDGQTRHSAATFAVIVGPAAPPPTPGPTPDPPPDPPAPPPGPTPPPTPVPPSGPDVYGAAKAAYDFALALPAGDRAKAADYAAALDRLAQAKATYVRPGHDDLERYHNDAFAALRALSGDGAAGWGLLDDRLVDWLRALYEEGILPDDAGYFSVEPYATLFADAARGLRAAVGR